MQFWYASLVPFRFPVSLYLDLISAVSIVFSNAQVTIGAAAVLLSVASSPHHKDVEYPSLSQAVVAMRKDVLARLKWVHVRNTGLKRGPRSSTKLLFQHDTGEDAGRKCLADGGMSPADMAIFEQSSICVGWEIKRNVALDDSGLGSERVNCLQSA